MRIFFILSCVAISIVVRAQNCPELLSVQLVCEGGDCVEVCPGEDISIIMDVLNPQDGDQYEVFYSDNPGFDPRNGDGTSLGRETYELQPCSGECPLVVAINIDGCETEDNEHIILLSKSGFEVDDLQIDFDEANNFCPSCGDLGPICSFLDNPTTNLGPCTGVIAAGPGDFIPPGSVVIVFVSAGANPNDIDFSGLCGIASGLSTPIYVLQSACNREAGAFSNGSATGFRTTVFEFCNGCTQTITYNTEDLLDEDGESWTEGALSPY